MQEVKWYFMFMGAIMLFGMVGMMFENYSKNNRFEACVKYHTPKECVDIK